jgi:hypothetical protein
MSNVPEFRLAVPPRRLTLMGGCLHARRPAVKMLMLSATGEPVAFVNRSCFDIMLQILTSRSLDSEWRGEQDRSDRRHIPATLGCILKCAVTIPTLTLLH